jgi:hypothetical protein
MINSRLVGGGQRIVWVPAQAIRATSHHVGRVVSSLGMGTPDSRTMAWFWGVDLSADADGMPVTMLSI